jgi:hypothetical protein
VTKDLGEHILGDPASSRRLPVVARAAGGPAELARYVVVNDEQGVGAS